MVQTIGFIEMNNVTAPKPESIDSHSPTNKVKPRLLYIGTLPCDGIAGGPIQLHRHFIESRDFDFQSIIEPAGKNFKFLETGISLIDRCLYRSGKTRFFSHLLACNYLMAEHSAVEQVLASADLLHPQAIVTIAYGSYSFVAAAVARRMKLPLIVFFHDWWPDLTPCQGWHQQWLDRRFQKLYHQSSLALCVCESMQAELGKHRNSRVLYPIPHINGLSSNVPSKKQDQLFQLTYLGTMEGDYGRLIQTLVKTLKTSPESPFQLKLYGSATDWPTEILKDAQESGLYGGRPYGVDAQNALTEADALLVVMSFTEGQRRRVSTSLPSKILEYAAYGKPIIVWGPEDCSAVKLVKKYSAGAVVSSPDPDDFIRCISQLAHDPVQQLNLSESATQLFDAQFRPEMIHQQLLSSLQPLLQR
jgi:glycosyltransferase involved in cell wall biosynthesis